MEQGCVLVPTLLDTNMDWILGRATDQRHCGATLADIKAIDYDTAGDVTESLETMAEAREATKQ